MSNLNRWMFLLAALAFAAAGSGCVQRRMLVRTNPPGAQLIIDDQEVGRTPASVPFTYYGTRKFTLIRDGYETVTTLHDVSPPWYEWPPLDFLSENLWPWEVRDERVIDFQMQPQQNVPTEQLMQRAEGLRQTTQRGYLAPTPGPIVAPVAPPNPGAPPPGTNPYGAPPLPGAP